MRRTHSGRRRQDDGGIAVTHELQCQAKRNEYFGTVLDGVLSRTNEVKKTFFLVKLRKE